MLNFGDFKELIKHETYFLSLIGSSAVTPDQIAQMAEDAKRKELKDYPDTHEYYFEGETPIEVPGAKISGCFIV